MEWYAVLAMAVCLATGFAVGHWLTPPKVFDSEATWFEREEVGDEADVVQAIKKLREQELARLKQDSFARKPLRVLPDRFATLGEARAYLRDRTSVQGPLLAVRAQDTWFIGGWY